MISNTGPVFVYVQTFVTLLVPMTGLVLAWVSLVSFRRIRHRWIYGIIMELR